MRPSMPFLPNGERVFDLWEDSRRAGAQPHSAPPPAGRRRRVIPATFGLTVALRLVPLVLIVLGLLLVEARG